MTNPLSLDVTSPDSISLGCVSVCAISCNPCSSCACSSIRSLHYCCTCAGCFTSQDFACILINCCNHRHIKTFSSAAHAHCRTASIASLIVVATSIHSIRPTGPTDSQRACARCCLLSRMSDEMVELLVDGARYGDIEDVNKALEAKVAVDAQDEWGKTGARGCAHRAH